MFFFEIILLFEAKSFLYVFFSYFCAMKMNTKSAYIQSLIAQGEHQQQDFKYEISDARKIAKTLSAFANTDGGRLLIGVKDNGKVAGVRSDEEQFMIEAAATLYCRPRVACRMQTFVVEGKTVLLAEVAESSEKPVCALDEVGKAWAYLRIADENVMASPIHIRAWQQQDSLSGELTEFTERERLLLRLLEERPEAALGFYCRTAHLSRRAVEALLAKFVRYGIVEAVYLGGKFRFKLK